MERVEFKRSLPWSCLGGINAAEMNNHRKLSYAWLQLLLGSRLITIQGQFAGSMIP